MPFLYLNQSNYLEEGAIVQMKGTCKGARLIEKRMGIHPI